jgi:DNA ligase (NAD+)
MRKLLLLFTAIQLTCAAAPQSVEQQADCLQVILRQADDAYHNHHQSLMSDAAYDALRGQYERLVSQYPELQTNPHVGAPTPKAGNRIPHTMPILSLQKAYSNEAVKAFLEKCGTNHLYCIEPKIDGLTIVLRYQNGLLLQAITRGDGKNGMDVTAAILASGTVPSELVNAPAQLEVRGEVFLTVPAFEALNHRRQDAGQPPLKSPRNTAAGTLRLSDYAEVANRNISIRIFELLATEPMPPAHTEALALFKSIGLPVIESHAATAADVLPAIKVLNQKRPELPYQTDGIVIRVNDRMVFEQLGATAHHPRGALARKYKTMPRETRLLSVEWSRGTTGKLTPVAHLEPIEIQGAIIQSATLHNLEHLRAMDLKLGDWIQVIRAGGSVPEIIGICPNRRTGNEIPIPDPAL